MNVSAHALDTTLLANKNVRDLAPMPNQMLRLLFSHKKPHLSRPFKKPILNIMNVSALALDTTLLANKNVKDLTPMPN
jgi:hypothetical protein